VKQPKSVESLSDITCETCDSYDQGTCSKELPAIPVGKGKRCSEGSWLLKGNAASFRQICLELLPFDFVADVEDLLCKHCVFYRPSRRECHFHRQNVFKSDPEDWCDNGLWLYHENEDEVVLAPLSLFYPND
jgi:hypothetical protein